MDQAWLAVAAALDLLEDVAGTDDGAVSAGVAGGGIEFDHGNLLAAYDWRLDSAGKDVTGRSTRAGGVSACVRKRAIHSTATPDAGG